MWHLKSKGLAKFSSILVFVLSLVAIVKLQASHYQEVATAIENSDHFETEQELKTQLNLRRLVPSFGFENLMADSLYLQFTQYFGDKTAREETGYSLVPEYFAAVVERDPLFFDAYISFSVANSMYAGQAEQTVELMNQILQSVPPQTDNAYQLWSLKAMDETLFLGDLAAAHYSHQQAASLAAVQDDVFATSAMALNLQKAKFLATKPDTTSAQITAWKSVLPNVVKEAEIQKIQLRINELETQLASETK